MSNEIHSECIAYDNYDDDFQHINFIFSLKFPFHYFEDYLMTKLTLG
jgi:hypothetical protein